MKCNGFNSDDYRYFYLDQSRDWSGFTNFSYGNLVENDIIKISKEDLSMRLFSNNYWDRIQENIYDHEIVEYPINEPFDLFKYIYMQNPITFKWDGVLSFVYDYGEYAFINEWLNWKMNSNTRSRRRSSDGSIREENEKVLNMIESDEKIDLYNSMLKLADTSNEKIAISEDQLPQKFKPQAFKFKVATKFELEYNKDESWLLTDISIFMALFDQDFIRLLANSTEILGSEKEKIFLEEYKDNIPNSTRRYYRVKENVIIDNAYQIMDSCSLGDFGVGFESLVVRMNGASVGTCELNRDNFYLDGNVKYFYVDYSDDFNDRIAEKEIFKIAYRVTQEEAVKIERENISVIRKKEEFEEAIEYINKHKKSYKKYCQRNYGADPFDFMQSEKIQLVKRLVKTFNNRMEDIK